MCDEVANIIHANIDGIDAKVVNVKNMILNGESMMEELSNMIITKKFNDVKGIEKLSNTVVAEILKNIERMAEKFPSTKMNGHNDRKNLNTFEGEHEKMRLDDERLSNMIVAKMMYGCA